jgi:hypothetical protein
MADSWISLPQALQCTINQISQGLPLREIYAVRAGHGVFRSALQNRSGFGGLRGNASTARIITSGV